MINQEALDTADLVGPSLILHKLAEFSEEAQTLAEMVLILQKFLAIRAEHVKARYLLRSMEILIYEESSSIARPINRLKIQSLLSQGQKLADAGARLAKAEEALALDPYDVNSNLMLAKAALELQLLPVAAFAYETLCEGNPEDIAQQHQLAEIYEQNGDFVEARSVYHQITELDPDDLSAIEGMKRMESLLEQRPKAMELPAESNRHAPSENHIRELEERLEGLGSKMEWLEAQTDANGELTQDAEENRSQTLAEINGIQLEILECKVAQDPKNLDLQFELGEARAVNGYFAQAVEAFELAKEQRARRDEALLHMGRCLIKEAERE